MLLIELEVIQDFLKDYIYLFLKRGEGREEERERHINVGETSIGCLADTRGLGTEPTTRHVP